MSKVLYEIRDHIAYIKLNSPEELNAIGSEIRDELIPIWKDIAGNEDVWVAILSGEGKSFCAGGNVKQMNRGAWELKQSWLLGETRCLPSEYKVYKPIIAAVHNHVYGAGFALAMESDIIVASENARFGLPEGLMNIPTLFAPILSKFLPHAIASELLYTAKPINAERAYQLGVANYVVPQENLMAKAQELAEQICKCGPVSIWATKKLYKEGANVNYDQYIELIREVATPVMNSEDSKEAKQAFIEKRKPVWKLK